MLEGKKKLNWRQQLPLWGGKEKLGKSTGGARVVFVMLYFLNCGEGEQKVIYSVFFKNNNESDNMADLKNLNKIQSQNKFYSFFGTLKYTLIFRMRTHTW